MFLNPISGCRIAGDRSDWNDHPSDKTLYNSPDGCGLPIGNLTSQLFSNVYLNELDQFMKRTLKCHHYGRYVDDFYVVGADRDWLLSIVNDVKVFLHRRLGLSFHDGKLKITSVAKGAEFIGAYLKQHRIYACWQTVGRIRRKLSMLAASDLAKWSASLNSFCGVLSHGKNYRLRRWILLEKNDFGKYGVFDRNVLKYNLCFETFEFETCSGASLRFFR